MASKYKSSSVNNNNLIVINDYFICLAKSTYWI